MNPLRIAAIASAALLALAPLPAAWVEDWYSRGFYITLQNVVTAATNRVPIALLDVAGVALAAWIVTVFWQRWRHSGLARAALQMAVPIATIAACGYLWFAVLWGLNYRRLPLESKLDFDQSRVTEQAARQLGEHAVAEVNRLRSHRSVLGGAGSTSSLEQAFAAAQSALGHRLASPGVPKRSLVGLYFRSAAIDGMTDPWFLEIIVNPDLLAFERPFVVAHEWAHLAGYAHEAEANFVAWLTCISAEADAEIQYSGWLTVYQNVWAGLPRSDRAELSAKLSPAVREDFRAMAARYETSTPIVRNAAREVYDSYLRANRVREGIASYNAVVRLLLGAGVADGRPVKIIAR